MEKEKIKCKNCGSNLTYIRVKAKERVCRKCGFTEKIEVGDGQSN